MKDTTAAEITIVAGAAEHIDAISALQRINLISNMADKDINNGFLTAELSPDHLTSMVAARNIMVALHEDQLAAFALSEPLTRATERSALIAEVERHLSGALRMSAATRDNVMFYGPVCIAQAYRGLGLLRRLIDEIKDRCGSQYSDMVTFVDERNARSLAAHARMGMVTLGEFAFNSNRYALVGCRI